MNVALAIDATDGAARAGTAVTPAGRTFLTPAFMPVGTRGAVRTLDSDDLRRSGVEVLLANTYHLMLRPGADAVEAIGGLHRFSSWDGPMLTDSGGFQVFSLPAGAVKVDDEGVTFKSTYDGSTHRLTPELAVEIQARLGADIQMVLDVCPPLPSEEAVIRLAVERTAAWAARARAVSSRADQALFGIVQGGVDPALRAESAARTVDIGFDGYGIGGLSVGESREEMGPALAATLDEDCPCPVCAQWSRAYLRHLLSVQEPTGPRLVTLHNLGWLVRFVADMRTAICAGRFDDFREETLRVWR